jgi:hypothetical protein
MPKVAMKPTPRLFGVALLSLGLLAPALAAQTTPPPQSAARDATLVRVPENWWLLDQIGRAHV